MSFRCNKKKSGDSSTVTKAVCNVDIQLYLGKVDFSLWLVIARQLTKKNKHSLILILVQLDSYWVAAYFAANMAPISSLFSMQWTRSTKIELNLWKALKNVSPRNLNQHYIQITKCCEFLKLYKFLFKTTLYFLAGM